MQLFTLHGGETIPNEVLECAERTVDWCSSHNSTFTIYSEKDLPQDLAVYVPFIGLRSVSDWFRVYKMADNPALVWIDWDAYPTNAFTNSGKTVWFSPMIDSCFKIGEWGNELLDLLGPPQKIEGIICYAVKKLLTAKHTASNLDIAYKDWVNQFVVPKHHITHLGITLNQQAGF